jgi:single-strand DNA-binding protein
MNEAQMTVTGYVASKPKLLQTKAGVFVSHMRVGVTPRLQDRQTGQWFDGDTTYMTINCWRSLATNVASCLRKGDPVVVKGRMRVRDFVDKDGNQRTNVEVDASTLGHDLTRGVAHFMRTKRSPGDAPQAGEHVNGDGRPAEWPGAGNDDLQPGSEHVPSDDILVAEMFDDAAVDASSVAFAGDGRTASDYASDGGGSSVGEADGDSVVRDDQAVAATTESGLGAEDAGRAAA